MSLVKASDDIMYHYAKNDYDEDLTRVKSHDIDYHIIVA